MQRNILLAVAFTATAALPSAADAHMRGGGLEIGGYLVRANFDNESNVEDDEGFGARLGILLARQHELEFSLDRIPTQDDLGAGLDVDITSFKAGYVYNFAPGGAVSPLFTAGGGFQRLSISDPFGAVADEHETDPLAFAGFGLRFFVGPVFNIRLDGQAQAVFPDGDPDDTLVDGLLSAGVGWVIGGR